MKNSDKSQPEEAVSEVGIAAAQAETAQYELDSAETEKRSKIRDAVDAGVAPSDLIEKTPVECEDVIEAVGERLVEELDKQADQKAD